MADAAFALAVREHVRTFLASAAAGDEQGLRAAAVELDAPLSELLPSVKDAHGRTAAHHASLNGRDALLATVATPEALLVRDDAGDTPLSVACRAGLCSTALLLLRLGADPRSRCATGTTPLHHAAGHTSCTQVVAALLKTSAADDVNALSVAGPPLLWASAAAHAGVVSLLVAAGCDVKCVDSDGVVRIDARKGALGSSCCEHSYRTKSTQGCLALVAAGGERPGAAETVIALLDAGAPIDATCDALDGAMAMDVAVACGAESVANVLRARGAATSQDPNALFADNDEDAGVRQAPHMENVAMVQATEKTPLQLQTEAEQAVSRGDNSQAADAYTALALAHFEAVVASPTDIVAARNFRTAVECGKAAHAAATPK